MKTARRKSNNGRKSATFNEPLLVDDIARYLDNLAWMFQDDRTGNAEFGDELRRLGDKLRPHGRLTVSELTIIGGDARFASKSSSSARNGKVADKKREDADALMPSLPENLRALSWEEVERYLGNDTLTKEQIAELGHVRFSISESNLLRLSKNRARAKILAALKTERMMRGVAEQASKAIRTPPPRSKPSASARSGKATDKKREGADAPTPSFPENPRALSGEEVERLLEDDSLAKLTKEQIAELGYARFSIAKSEILRLSKNRARKRILDALKTERTMQGVAEQARRAGMMRSA